MRIEMIRAIASLNGFSRSKANVSKNMGIFEDDEKLFDD